jgi:hypothetical protein
LLYILPPFFALFNLFYFLEAVEFAAIDTAASLSRFVPDIGVSQIIRPKRPRSALARPNRVNHTSFLAVYYLQKYTIFSVWLLNNRCPQPSTPEIPLP